LKTQSQDASLHPFLFMFMLRHTVKCMCGNLWWQLDSDVLCGFQCIYKLDMFQDRQCTCNIILWHFHLKFIPPHLNSIIQFHLNLCLWQQWVLGIVELNIIALETQQCISFILQTHICRCQQHKYWMHCHGNATMCSLCYCCWAKTFVMFIPPWLS